MALGLRNCPSTVAKTGLSGGDRPAPIASPCSCCARQCVHSASTWPLITTSRGAPSACLGRLHSNAVGGVCSNPPRPLALLGSGMPTILTKTELFVEGAWIGARASARTRGVDCVLARATGGLNTNRAVRVACSGRAARSSSAVCATRPTSATCAAPSSSATCAARSTAGTAAASPRSLRQRTGTQCDCRH
jgi:hypothetical protein